RAMALSSDGRWLVTAGPGHLQVQEAGGAVHDLHSGNGHYSVHAVAFSAGGRWLVASCTERDICVYEMRDIASGRPIKQWPHDDGVVSALAFTPDGRWLATGSYQSPAVRVH